MGRDSTFRGLTPKQVRYLVALSQAEPGATKDQILSASGVSRSAFYRWLRSDERFRVAMDALPREMARSAGARIWQALIARAVGGDVTAIATFLKYTCGDTLQVEHRGRIEHAVTHTLDLSRLDDQQLITLEDILTRARAGETVEERMVPLPVLAPLTIVAGEKQNGAAS